MTPRILVTRRWPASVEAYLNERYDVTLNLDDAQMDKSALAKALRDYDIICPSVSDRIDAEVLAGEGIRTRLLSNFGVGFEHIDIERCRAQGITVTNTPGVLTEATAETALLLMLMAARRGGEGERVIRSGNWKGWGPTHLLGAQLHGKTLGLVGFGRIAQATAHKAHHGFGMRIAYQAPRRQPDEIEAAVGATYHESLEALLGEADFISLHCPGGAATENLIDADRLKQMKSTAFLINTARGSVIDDAALVAALSDGTIAGAGLDVFRNEPNVPPAYLTCENVVLLPHLGSATLETRTAMGMRAVANLEKWLADGEPVDRVV